MILVLNKAGRVLYESPSWVKTTGYPAGSFSRRPLVDFIHPKDLDTVRKDLAGLMRVEANGIPTVFRFKKPDGAWIELEAIGEDLLEKPEIGGIVITARDVADRKAAREAAEGATRAKGEFLANISHEMRTPLNAIIGITELILEMDLAEAPQELAKTVSREADHLLQVVNGVLDFSKIESGRLEPEFIRFDLGYLMDSVADTFALESDQKGLGFSCYLEPDVPVSLQGDPGRLRQILVNLAGNAIKFTPSGEVCVKGMVQEDLGERVALRFSVRDTGIGIPGIKQPLIFESFTQADGSMGRKYGGTGLGTTIAKKLVELMGGSIHLASEVGKGSHFWFDLTFRKQAGQTVSEPLMKVKLPGIRVLIVYPRAANRGVLKGQLLSMGCEVEEAEDGESGLKKLEETAAAGTRIDLVISDREMPGMNGFDLAAAMRRDGRWHGIPILMVTCMGQLGDGKLCRENGIQGYLTKPIKRGALERSILKVLAAPVPDAAEGAALVTRHSLMEEQRRSPRILVVDDYNSARWVVVNHLRNAGYTVDEAEDGQAAVDAAKAEFYDLILMDIQMPVMDGYEAARLIRKSESTRGPGGNPSGSAPGRRVPILALTAHALQEFVESCLRAGMDGVLTKPIRKQVLLDSVAQWIFTGRKRIASEASGEKRPEVPGRVFDEARALREFESDRAFLDKVIEEFLKQAESQIRVLPDAYASGETEAIYRAAHAVKGGAANLTAMELSDAARDLEAIAGSGDLAGCPEAIDKLQAAFHRLKEYIRPEMSFQTR